MDIYNNENTLFFLFTCVKDGRPYINKLFDSLLSQTKVNFVHYIYEDGSNDPIEDLVDVYKEKVSKLDHPYKVIYEKNPTNMGLNMATRHCIDMCCCPYFIWIDCDNWVDENFFKELEITAQNNKSASLIRTTLRCVKNGEVFKISEAPKKPYNQIFQLRELMRGKYIYSFFAVKYDFYNKINPNNILLKSKTFYNDDQVLLLLLLNNKCSFAYSDKSIGYFLNRYDAVSSECLPFHIAKDDQIKLCYEISENYGNFVKYFYIMKSLLNGIDAGKTKYKEKHRQLKLVFDYSRRYKIPLDVLNTRNIYLKNIKYFLLGLVGK